MTTIYLIRHSNKEKNYGGIDCNDSFQIRNEKIILSIEGEKRALLLSQQDELKDINEVWSSNYVRAIQTAKYICAKNNVKLNISSSFDERHYGNVENIKNKEEFWIQQFIDENLKQEQGESRIDVQNRLDKKIKDIIKLNDNKKIAIVCHNACILMYLLKYCKLENARLNKKLTISYKNKIIINDDIMASPSIIKLEFDTNELKNISYIKITE